MRLLSLSLAIILGGLAGAILIGGAAVLAVPAGRCGLASYPRYT